MRESTCGTTPSRLLMQELRKKKKKLAPLKFGLGRDVGDSYLVSSHFLVRRGPGESVAFFPGRRYRFFRPPATTSVRSRITQLNFSQLHSPPARARCRHSAHAPASLTDLSGVLTEMYYINNSMKNTEFSTIFDM